MSIYSHYTDADLTALRDRLTSSLHDRLTTATSVSFNGRSVGFQQRTDDIRKEIDAVGVEISRRMGRNTRGPIYVV